MNRLKRMRRGAAALFATVLLLCACSETPDAEAYEALSGLHAALSAQTRADIGFRMEATFRDPETGVSSVLYYLDGETRYDSVSRVAWQRFNATRLAATVNAEEYYADGVRTHLENGEMTLLPAEPEALFGAFPYQTVPLPALSELKSLKTEENGSGTLYTLVSQTGQKQLIEDVWGLDLYALAEISTPDREKESYGDVTYSWAVTDAGLQTLFVQLTVTLYEKAGYTPGYTPKDDDYRLDLTLQAQISFRDAGEHVEIPAYEAAA